MNLSKNVLVHFIGKLVPAMSQLIILVLGVRLLGTAEYGKYNLLFSTSMIISSLMVGWIQQSILRFFFEDTETQLKKSANFYSLTLPAGIFSFIITFIFCRLYFHTPIYELLVLSGFTGLFSFFLVSLTLKQANLKPASYAIAESFFYAVSMGIFLYGALVENIRDSALIFEGMLAALVIWYIIRIVLTGKEKRSHSNKLFNWPGNHFFKKMLSYGAPITLWLLISNFYNVFDRYIINHYIGFDAVGVYGSVYDLIYKIGGFMTLPVLLTYHPAISRAWSGADYTQCKELIIQAITLELAVMIVVFCGFYFFSEYLFQLIFNRSVPELKSLFVPLALSAVLWQLSLIIQKPLEFNFRQKLMIGGILLTIITNGILNIITVPIYGYVVSAYNTLLCTGVYFLFVLYFAKEEIRFKI